MNTFNSTTMIRIFAFTAVAVLVLAAIGYAWWDLSTGAASVTTFLPLIAAAVGIATAFRRLRRNP